MNAFKKGLLLLAIGAIILFIIIAINQTVALYYNLAQWSPVFAAIITALVGIVFAALLLLPIWGFVRYPKAIHLPENEESPEYQASLQVMLQRLQTNKVLLGQHYEFVGETDLEKIQGAYAKLKEISDHQIKKDANAVFMTTAISQNGVLDGATVLFTLLKMVYYITRVYESRPTMTRMIYLYGQIATVVLVARTMEDLDLIEEQLEPILTSLLGGSIVSLVPGAMGVTTLVVNSLVEGSVNALLTLRVGTIAQRYLAATVKPDKKALRRGASMEAAGHLGTIIGNNAKYVVESVTRAAKKATVDKIKWPWNREENPL